MTTIFFDQWKAEHGLNDKAPCTATHQDSWENGVYLGQSVKDFNHYVQFPPKRGDVYDRIGSYSTKKLIQLT